MHWMDPSTTKKYLRQNGWTMFAMSKNEQRIHTRTVQESNRKKDEKPERKMCIKCEQASESGTNPNA